VRKKLKILFWISLGVFAIYMAIPFPKNFMKIQYSKIIRDEHGKNLRVFLSNQEQWCFPPEDSILIPDKLESAVLTFEDNYFRWHPGINPVLVFKAARLNFRKGKVVSGASTITMQVARIRGRHHRNWGNKFLEMFQALKIELHYSKKSILKLYLDHAPYGSNIIGYRAASARYFRKAPNELSWAEASLLAVLPNAPSLVSPLSNPEVLTNKRNVLLKKLLEKKKIDSTTYGLSVAEPIPQREFPFEIMAGHLTQRLKSQNSTNSIITTTLDYRIQKHLEYRIRQYSLSLRQQGIKNVAVLVVETQTGKVKAYVGSQDFFDKEGLGQVDGIMARRSSGSILKPFLYALSMDEGIILPQTQVTDIPSYFDAFTPNNADEKYNGVILSKEALVRSLNIPAVRLLNTYGVTKFYSFLTHAGISTLFRQPDDYGLPLILGGAEVTVWDMATLYKGLGSRGNFAPVHYLLKDSARYKNEHRSLISSGACFLTLEMLKELKRPGSEYYWEQYQNQKPLAWKTGTSYGHKDAWAVGVSPQWTIAVWVGNFDSESNLNLSGAASAGPLLFGIFNYLPKEPKLKWFEKIEMDFKEVEICEETGFLASSNCEHKTTVNAPVYMLPLRQCPYHEPLFVDKEEKYSVCSFCWEEGHHEKKLLIYPADISYYLKQRGQPVSTIPDHNPNCEKIAGTDPLKILYPIDSARIWIPRDFDGNYQKVIAKLAHHHPEKKVFWYMDGNFLGTSSGKHNKAIEIKTGWHQLSVTDEDGHTSRIRFHGREKIK
jgi:penicillin-binding protein 1C